MVLMNNVQKAFRALIKSLATCKK